MFKVRHTTLDRTVLEIREGMEAKKHSASVSTVENRMVKYNKLAATYQGFVDDEKITDTTDVTKLGLKPLKAWCDIRKKKADPTQPKKVADLRAYASTTLAGREPMTMEEYLVDTGLDIELVRSVMSDPDGALAQGDDEEGEEEYDEEEEAGDSSLVVPV